MATRQQAKRASGVKKAGNLLAQSSPKVRSQTTAALAAEFAHGGMTESERRVAVGILEIMARDVEQQVRESLSEQVKNCPFLPHALAKTLAEDIDTVSLPVIQLSTVLSDTDLLAIIAGGSTEKQIAVAKRKTVSPKVSDRLVETNNENVVGALLSNDGARLSEKSYTKVVKQFPDNEKIQTLLADRPTLPLAIIERLVSSVSLELRERIINRHDFPSELADRIVTQGREGALTRSMAGVSRINEIEGLITRLKSKGQLTPTLILRALCEGDLQFFDAAVGALAGVSVDKARPFIYERGAGGLRMIFRNTGLPTEMFRAVNIAISVINAARKEQPDAPNFDLSERIVARLVEEYDELSPEGMENVLAQLAHKIFGRWEEPPKVRIAPAKDW
jgi:uncharacterized protein (DUF2336 family)